MSDKCSHNQVFEGVRTLAIVFLVLKLAGLVSWSWWWVTAPMWFIPASIVCGGAVVLFGAALWTIADMITKKLYRRQR